MNFIDFLTPEQWRYVGSGLIILLAIYIALIQPPPEA